MKLGYNTNGLAHHDPIEAIRLLSETGYKSVALTVDHGLLSPLDPHHATQLQRIKAALGEFQMGCVIETGARFLLNPRSKHDPTLVSLKPEDRQKRVDFYKYCIDVAAILDADCVSIWSGILKDPADDDEVLTRLADGLSRVLDSAAQQNVMIGFEPEPGMYIESMSQFDRLLQWVKHPNLGLTLDVGHLYCLGEVPLVDYIKRWGDRLINVHLEDMKAGIHEHLMFGEGDIAFPPVIEALSETGFKGGVHIELSRHSHMAVQAVQQAFDFLHPLWP
jgi:L-ribulose-5-phosphate 3-epimerase